MTILKQVHPFYTKLAMVLISVICLFYIAILGKNILAPLLFALLFSVLLLPVAGFLEKKLRIHRSLAAILSVLLLMLSIAAVVYIVISQISTMGDDWPQFKLHLLSSLKELHQWISLKFHINTTRQNNYVNNAVSQMLSNGPSIINGILSSVSSLLLYVLFTLVDTFFLLYYRRLLVKFLVSVFREEDSEAVYDIVKQVQHRISRYIQGLLIEMTIVSTVCCLTLWILGIDYPVLLGLLTGLLNLIPYVGILFSLLISTLIAFATAGASKILLVTATLFGIHLLDANVLLPLLVAAKVRLNALITIIGVIVGGSVWGIAGAFLAVPVIAIIKIVFDRIESLKPWGMLLGDERDEKSPPPLKFTIKKDLVYKIGEYVRKL
jgi:predicted PurR-regulated permease PerM